MVVAKLPFALGGHAAFGLLHLIRLSLALPEALVGIEVLQVIGRRMPHGIEVHRVMTRAANHPWICRLSMKVSTSRSMVPTREITAVPTTTAHHWPWLAAARHHRKHLATLAQVVNGPFHLWEVVSMDLEVADFSRGFSNWSLQGQYEEQTRTHLRTAPEMRWLPHAAYWRCCQLESVVSGQGSVSEQPTYRNAESRADPMSAADLDLARTDCRSRTLEGPEDCPRRWMVDGEMDGVRSPGLEAAEWMVESSGACARDGNQHQMESSISTRRKRSLNGHPGPRSVDESGRLGRPRPSA
jgi:hypothetical protein